MALALAGCATGRAPMPILATARVASDFETYRVERVGLMPFQGSDLTAEQSAALEAAFFTEISHSTPFELVLLAEDDLAEVRHSDAYRRGWYAPETIVAVGRRYSLDAVLFGTVTQSQFFPPQKLSVSVDMVAAETGLVIWSSAVHLDATEERVRNGLEAYFSNTAGEAEDAAQDWRLALLSPSKFAQFAAFQVASML
jgi:hypothetical protein